MNKNIYSYVIPSMIASVFLGIYVLVDGIFLGSKLGDYGLASLNMSWPITAVIQMIGLSIGMSSGILMSIANSKKEYQKEKDILNTSIIFILIMAVISTILFLLIKESLLRLLGAEGLILEYGNSYLTVIISGSIFQLFSGATIPLLKNKGMVKKAMLITITSTLINVLFDYIFLYTIDLGIEGVALATMISQAFISISGLILIKHKPYFKNFYFLDIIKRMFAPFLINYSYAIITIINNYFSIKLGNESLLACYTLLSYLLYIVSSQASGCGDGMQPVVSYYYGKNDDKRVNKDYIKTLILGFLFTLTTILIFIFSKDYIIRFFNLSQDASNYYNMYYIYYMLGFLLLSTIRISICLLYAILKTFKANFLALLEPLILTPIIIPVLSILIGPKGLFLGFLIIQIIVVFSCSFIMIIDRKRLSKNKYNTIV